MKLSLHVGSEVSLENFSLSQLISSINDLFVTEGLPGFLKVFLKTIEEKLIGSGIKCKHCDATKLYSHSTCE